MHRGNTVSTGNRHNRRILKTNHNLHEPPTKFRLFKTRFLYNNKELVEIPTALEAAGILYTEMAVNYSAFDA